ncbi:hypothetical protein VNO77_46302 [Canavalia gladiata]|uniref:Uncharacterized protein n=1 Tax=Canavalia gladiata TaxID=3824 RepID=A0AAN9JIS8_CANGL
MKQDATPDKRKIKARSQQKESQDPPKETDLRKERKRKRSENGKEVDFPRPYHRSPPHGERDNRLGPNSPDTDELTAIDGYRELNYMCVKQSSSGPPFVGLFVTLSVSRLATNTIPNNRERKYTFTPFYRFFLTQLLAYCPPSPLHRPGPRCTLDSACYRITRAAKLASRVGAQGLLSITSTGKPPRESVWQQNIASGVSRMRRPEETEPGRSQSH